MFILCLICLDVSVSIMSDVSVSVYIMSDVSVSSHEGTGSMSVDLYYSDCSVPRKVV